MYDIRFHVSEVFCVISMSCLRVRIKSLQYSASSNKLMRVHTGFSTLAHFCFQIMLVEYVETYIYCQQTVVVYVHMFPHFKDKKDIFKLISITFVKLSSV